MKVFAQEGNMLIDAKEIHSDGDGTLYATCTTCNEGENIYEIANYMSEKQCCQVIYMMAQFFDNEPNKVFFLPQAEELKGDI